MFRSQRYCSRYENTPIYLDTPVTRPADGAHQKKTNYTFTINDRSSHFDWYNGYFEIKFKVEKLADGGDYAGGDRIAMINDAASIIGDIQIKQNGKIIYDCNNLHRVVNIKNLLEMTPDYANTTGTNEFFALDLTDKAESRDDQAGYNKGFEIRKGLVQGGNEVDAIIPLNKYSFFEGLEKNLLPPSQIQITLQINEDNELIFKSSGDDGRVVVTRLVLWIPRMIFNSQGLDFVMENHMISTSWGYLREMVQQSGSSKQTQQVFRISAGVKNPKHVFVYLQRANKANNSEANPLLLDTFKVNSANDNCHLSTARLELGNGIFYPENEYTSDEPSRIYKDLINYSFKQNDKNSGTLLNRLNFHSLFGMIYFNLTYTRDEVTTDPKQLTLRIQLNREPAADYIIYAVVLYEENVVINTIGNELVIA